MIVTKQPTFPDPVMFVLGSHKSGATDQRIGALIAKHVSSGAPEVLLKDEGYAANDFDPVRIEADVVPFKPFLDVVVVGSEAQADIHAPFGNITITRGGAAGAGIALVYGWRERGESPRKDEAGDVDNFAPDVNNPAKLPTGFNDRFFNGSPIAGAAGAPLATGDSVDFAGTSVTVPAAPALVFKLDGQPIPDPVWLARGVDTVVYVPAENRFLLTWRFVFVWEARLELAELEVS